VGPEAREPAWGLGGRATAAPGTALAVRVARMGRIRLGSERLPSLLGGPARLHVVLVLAAIVGLQSADSGAIGALAAPIEAAFHVGNTGLGLLVAASTIVGAVTCLPFGVYVDRYNRTRILGAVAVVWGVSTALSGASSSFGMLLAIRVFQGGMTAVIGPALASLAGDLFPTAERSRLWSYVLTGELVGAGIGITVSGVLSGLVGWRPALSVLGIPAFLLAWAIHRYLPEPARGGRARLHPGAVTIPTAEDVGASAGISDEPPVVLEAPSEIVVQAERMGFRPYRRGVIERSDDPDIWTATRYALRIRSNDALILASGIGYFFEQGVQTFMELFLRERFGVGQAAASLLFVVVASGALLGVVLGGQAADRLVRTGRPTGRLVVAAVALGGVTAVFAPAMLIPSIVWAVPALALAAVLLGAINPPMDTARLDVVPSFLWGRAEAIRTTIRQSLEGFAPLLFGVVSVAFGAPRSGFGAGVDTRAVQVSAASAQGLEVAFVVFSLPMLLAGGLLWASRHPYLRDVLGARRSEERRAAPRAGSGSGAA